MVKCMSHMCRMVSLVLVAGGTLLLSGYVHASEAELKIPELTTVYNIFGIGMLISVLGMVFGFIYRLTHL